jgi:hypothetical protein
MQKDLKGGILRQHTDPSNVWNRRLTVQKAPSGKDKCWVLGARGISCLLPLWVKEMVKKESKRATADKRSRKRQYTIGCVGKSEISQ